MSVSFDNLDDFLADLASEAADQQVDDQIVRVSLMQRKIDRTTTDIAVTAGYMSLGELRQFAENCGSDFQGAKSEGTELASGIIERVRTACRAQGLTVRGGRFDD